MQPIAISIHTAHTDMVGQVIITMVTTVIIMGIIMVPITRMPKLQPGRLLMVHQLVMATV